MLVNFKKNGLKFICLTLHFSCPTEAKIQRVGESISWRARECVSWRVIA